MSDAVELDKPVVLVGMPGSGKSHAGRLLAERLRVPFYDTDHLIEEAQRSSIADLFASRGEAFFRGLEHETIARVLRQGPGVISTGGGALTTPAVLEDIKAHAISIWLTAEMDALVDRVRRHAGKRPLLADGDQRSRMERLWQDRKGLYAQADLVVDNTHNDVVRMMDDIIFALNDFMRKQD
ncbi:MAG: shikimate kinase [Alphaproteobacteria bacterium]|nr:shikimate kinase [Alphaproteobacteria bacterium]